MRAVDVVLVRRQLERREEHARHAALDVLPAQLPARRSSLRRRRAARRCPRPARAPRASGDAIIPWQIGSKISVSPRSGISSPNERPPAACGALTNVPDPARRSTRPAAWRSRTARPTVMRDAPNGRTSSASLGSRSPAWPAGRTGCRAAAPSRPADISGRRRRLGHGINDIQLCTITQQYRNFAAIAC